MGVVAAIWLGGSLAIALSLLALVAAATWGWRRHARRARAAAAMQVDLSRLTIIVPAHNAAPILEPALRALARYPELRVIVVADHCTDHTAEVVERYARTQLTLLTLIRRTGAAPGKSAALNLAMSRVETEYVGFMDADMSLGHDALHTLLGCVSAGDTDLVAGLIEFRAAHDPRLLRVTQWQKYLSHPIIRFGRYVLYGATDLPGQLFLARTDRIRGVQFPEDSLADDTTFAFRAVAAGLRLRIVPVVLADELPRASLKSWLLQRIRQHTGYGQAMRHFLRSILACRSIRHRIGLMMQFVVYDIYPVVIVVNALLTILDPRWWPVLALLLATLALALVAGKLRLRRMEIADVWGLCAYLVIKPVLDVAGLCTGQLLASRNRARRAQGLIPPPFWRR